MKKLYMPILALILAQGSLWAADDNSQKPERRTLVVTGSADITVAPDICYMSFAVETNNRKAGDAYKDNVELMNRINAAVKAQGVEAKDMQTTNFSIAPNYQYTEKGKRIFLGYRVYNTLFVAVRNLSKVPAVLDAAIDAGALDVGGISFTVEDSKKYTEEVRRQALREARKKAEESAQILGFKLGTPINVSEAQPYDYNEGYSKATGMMDRAVAEEAPAPAIEAGQLKLSRTVYVTYEILPL